MCRRLQRIERHRRGVGVLSLRHDRHPVALAPRLQLRNGRGAERVAGREHQRAAFVLEPSRQLADGGGLAHAVDADREQHERLRTRVHLQGHGDRLEHRDEVGAQRTQQRGRIGELAGLHALAQPFDQLRRGGDADVRGQQCGLDFVQQVVVEPGIA